MSSFFVISAPFVFFVVKNRLNMPCFVISGESVYYQGSDHRLTQLSFAS